MLSREIRRIMKEKRMRTRIEDYAYEEIVEGLIRGMKYDLHFMMS